MAADSEKNSSTAPPPLAMVAVLLALLCAAIYASSGRPEFVGDDVPAIVDNAALHWRELSLAHVRDAFARPNPIVQLSYGLNYRLGRLDVHDYRAVNTALHVVNALLVFALGNALFRRAGAAGASARAGLSDEAAPWAALAGAALFAAHPLQVEAVTWIAQRGSLLAALGSLAATLCYLHARDPGRSARALWWAAAGACWLFAIGSREAAVALPVAIVLCEWLLRGDRAAGWARFAQFPALQRSISRPTALNFPPYSALPALLLAAAVLWMTVRNASALALCESLVVWPPPARLNLVHDLGSSPLAFGAAVALQILLLGAAAASARRYRIFSFALLWFFGAHAGEFAFGSSPLAAEHRNYFALIGPALSAAWLLFSALSHRLGLAAALTVLGVVSLGFAAHARNGLWRDPGALWDDAVAKSPGSAIARLERGALREVEGRVSEALADFDEAVRLAPDSARARERLAAGLAGLGRVREALPHAREAVALDPASAVAHAALGRTLASLGELEPAAAAFARALELGGEPGLERNLGDTLVRLGRFEESLPHFRAAIERDPGDDDARTGAGAALVELGRARDALAYLEPAVESQPNPRYLVHFADALWQLGDADGALDAAAMAVRVGPSWPGATSRLAWMLALCPDAARRDPARALRIADIALARTGPPDPALLDARAAALAAAGRFADARAAAERAADLAREAGDVALAAQVAAHAERYARRQAWPDPPHPFEPSP